MEKVLSFRSRCHPIGSYNAAIRNGRGDKQYAGANDSNLTSPGKRRTTFLLIIAN